MNKKIITISFCEPFVPRLVDWIERNYIKKGKDLRRLAIVFGGKRPELFLRRELSQRLKKSYYPPKYFTIDQFVKYIVEKKQNITQPQDLDSCYLLYKLAQKHCPDILKDRENFAQFLPWTKEILSFIDQLDLEHIEDATLLNIEANAQIGYDVPEDINRLLQHITVLRKAYHQELQDEELTSRGWQYSQAAEIIKDVKCEEFDQILFCNFFYFNQSEENIVRELLAQDKATLIFQGDDRKWPILNRLARKLETPIREGKEVDQTKFNLKLYSGFDAHSQLGLVHQILKTIKNPENTVLVLPNADHIVPVLSEITETVKEFNISMGYPLKRSSLYTLIDLIFKAQLTCKDGRYYAKDYLRVLRHPFIKNIKFEAEAAITRIIIHKIEEMLKGQEESDIAGLSFLNLKDIENVDELYNSVTDMLTHMGMLVSRDDFNQVIVQLHQILFTQWEAVNSFESFANALSAVLNVLLQKSFMHQYPLNLNIVEKMFVIVDELKNSSFKDEPFEREEIFRIFDQKIMNEIVAFHGSPLKGLQILGLFETRSLNFDNVIVLDVNEGVLPKLKMFEPLIPREVMLSLKLDRLEFEEEIQRYQFMRLISSAKNVHLVYQENKEKERSRFVEELIWEVEKTGGDLDVVPVARSAFKVSIKSQPRTVKKTAAMIEMLKNHKYSASSVNTYLRNPMDFYYKYVLGIREQEDLLDEPEAKQVGTFIHTLLENQFKPFIGQQPIVDEHFKKKFMTAFEDLFQSEFGKSMKADSFLLKAVIDERLRRFVENEQEAPDRYVKKILHLEKYFQDEILLSCGNIQFGYIVDRIDEMQDGTIMIIDYKTGSSDIVPRNVEDISVMPLSREAIRDEVQSFQIPLYYYFLTKMYPDGRVNAALYNIRTLELHKFIDKRIVHLDKDFINETFMKCLDFIITEILNPEVDFIDDPI